MSEDKLYNNADDFLRAKFDGAAETPSDFVWENIEQKLDEPKRKRRFLFWLLPLLLLISVTTIWIYTPKNKNNNNNNIANITTANNNTLPIKKPVINSADVTDEMTNQKQKLTFSETQKNTLNEITDKKAITKKSDTINNILNEKEQQLLQQKTKYIEQVVVKKDVVETKQIKNKASTYTSQKNTTKSIKSSFFNSNKNVANVIINTTQFDNNKDQKNTKNNSVFAAAKSYTDIVKIKKDFEPQVNTIIARTVDIIDTKANNSISSPIVSNKPVIADTVAKISVDTTTKTTDTTSNKKEDIAKMKNKKQLDKYLKLYITPNVSNNSFAASNTAYDFLNEKGKLVFSIGASYSFAISNKFAINAGLGYDRLNFSLDNTPLTFGRFITKPYIFHSSIGDMAVAAATMKDGFSPASPTFPTQFKINYNYNYSLLYITIPIEVQYKLIDRKIKISITSGIATQFIIQQNATLNLVKERLTNTITFNSFDLNKTNFAASLGFNFQFPLNNKWCFYFEPTNKFLLTPLNKSALVSTKFSSFGLTIGAALKLSKK